MLIKNKFIVILYRIFFLLICGYGLYLHSGISQGTFDKKIFFYYTILSNLICFIYIFLCLIKNILQFNNWDPNGIHVILPKLKGAITLYITITFLVYHFVLVPSTSTINTSYEMFGLPDLIVHYFVPILMIFDWILFDKKNVFTNKDPILWLILPYFYLIFLLIRGCIGGPLTSTGSKYPYFFLDIDKLGLLKVFTFILLLSVVALLVGYIIFAIDSLLGTIHTKEKVASK